MEGWLEVVCGFSFRDELGSGFVWFPHMLAAMFLEDIVAALLA